MPLPTIAFVCCCCFFSWIVHCSRVDSVRSEQSSDRIDEKKLSGTNDEFILLFFSLPLVRVCWLPAFPVYSLLGSDLFWHRRQYLMNNREVDDDKERNQATNWIEKKIELNHKKNPKKNREIKKIFGNKLIEKMHEITNKTTNRKIYYNISINDAVQCWCYHWNLFHSVPVRNVLVWLNAMRSSFNCCCCWIHDCAAICVWSIVDAFLYWIWPPCPMGMPHTETPTTTPNGIQE